jgi:hypothetical protein
MSLIGPIYTVEGKQIRMGAIVEQNNYEGHPEIGIVVGETKKSHLHLAQGSHICADGSVQYGFLFTALERNHIIGLTPGQATGFTFEGCFLVLKTPYGWRGSNHHLHTDGSELKVLAKGKVGGHEGAGTHLIIVLERGKTLKAQVIGRYRGPKSFEYFFDGKDLKVKTWGLW